MRDSFEVDKALKPTENLKTADINSMQRDKFTFKISIIQILNLFKSSLIISLNLISDNFFYPSLTIFGQTIGNHIKPFYDAADISMLTLDLSEASRQHRPLRHNNGSRWFAKIVRHCSSCSKTNFFDKHIARLRKTF